MIPVEPQVATPVAPRNCGLAFAFVFVLTAALGLACADGGLFNGPSWDTASGPSVTVFAARQIVTMDPERPEARAVAVENGRIVALGSERDIARQLPGRRLEVDRRFAEYVLLPGFVENHLHPTMAALILPMEFVTPFAWDLPTRRIEGVRGAAAYLERLGELDAAFADPKRWLFAWGYHPLFHGELSRAALDEISSTRPIVAWHRSFHEIYVNSAALAQMGITAERVAGNAQVDLAKGHFFETGLAVAFQALTPRLLAPERLARGLSRMRDAVHAGGITTVADMAFGLFDPETEWQSLVGVLDNEATPFRVALVPDARRLAAALGPERALAYVESLPARNTGRLRFSRQVKLFADGAFYSQLMQMGPPGYLDGHKGEWLMKPAELETAARHWWNAGYQIHVHVNGDLGVQVVLDVLEKLRRERPTPDHRFTLHHFGYSTPAQSQRIKTLGAHVSANPYYIYTLGDAYRNVGLGRERASHMVRLGSLVRAGVPVSLHSDFTMAPAEPLRLAEVAATRRTASGAALAPGERLSVAQALRAITIDAARAIRMEDEIGSIRVGKRADFAVLERDPRKTPAHELSAIPIWGTVYEGRPYPLFGAPAPLVGQLR